MTWSGLHMMITERCTLFRLFTLTRDVWCAGRRWCTVIYLNGWRGKLGIYKMSPYIRKMSLRFLQRWCLLCSETLVHGATLIGERGVREHGIMNLATWLGMPKSLTLRLSHLMMDLLPHQRTGSILQKRSMQRDSWHIDDHQGCRADIG